MSDAMVIACPTCGQKYRVPASRIGEHARCKKCAQRFRIAAVQPIDDETIFGWVMEEEQEEEPARSVMGSTSIFTPKPKSVSLGRRPTLDDWETCTPASSPRVRLERIDDKHAYFTFPADALTHRRFRASFPHQCVRCLRRDELVVHLVIWGDKLPRKGAFHLRDIETKAFGAVDQLLRARKRRWFDHLEPLAVLPPPYCNPFPYFVCTNCQRMDAVVAQVDRTDEEEFCRIGIANLEIAREFYFNNGGKDTSGYRRLVKAAERQRDDRWQKLASPVRKRIATWYRPKEKERFLAYFADADFSRNEAGTAGVVLTDRRLIYKKYATKREFDVAIGGTLDITADRKSALIRICQDDVREAVLCSNPVAASHLARALTKLDPPWTIKVHTSDDAAKNC